MASFESVNTLLTVAARLLDQAASDTRDAKLDPVHANIEKIGRALAEVFEVQHKIYELEPRLKPEYLNEVSPSPEADRVLTRYMGEAIGMEQSGDIEGAIEKLREFLLLESSPHHQAIAQGEIGRLGGA
jgi:hypothetical protein